jgi:hypothetical protein
MQGCNHDVYTSGESFRFSKSPPGVCVSNDDDSHYVQLFESRAEVDAFIARLNAVADEVWPRDSSPK